MVIIDVKPERLLPSSREDLSELNKLILALEKQRLKRFSQS